MIRRRRIASSNIDIKTQVKFPKSTIDMVFRLNGTVSIGVENKLWSQSEGDLLSVLSEVSTINVDKGWV